jgi:ABC-type uncharacterized transport system substrate-binding protein
MKRRGFITLLGGAAAWPLTAYTQQPERPVVGFLSSVSPAPYTHFVAAFRQGLGETGFIEGRNVAIEYRWAENQHDRLPVLALDLVRRQAAVIVVNSPSTAAAKAATTTIPIVFITGGDAVQLGFVATLNRPERNVTGVSFLVTTLGAKRLELLRELMPMGTVVGFLVDPTNPSAEAETRDMQAAADALGRKLLVVKTSSESEVETAFASLARQRVDAVIVAAEAFFLNRREHLVAVAARHAIPTMYHLREIAAAGGLMSYGTSIREAYRQAGIYTGRILNGARPADLPVIQSTKFELIINLKTAKSLGLDVPAKLLALADEVIE